MSALGGHFVTAPLCPAVSLCALPLAQDPTLCLIHGRHTINATLIEFDLFEFYIYPIICFDMPFANAARITGNKGDFSPWAQRECFLGQNKVTYI